MVIKREGKKNLLSHTLQYPTETTSTGEPFCHRAWKDWYPKLDDETHS